jgi:uncharacterized membrane-anchored protein YhcB (DUF1043 family)
MNLPEIGGGQSLGRKREEGVNERMPNFVIHYCCQLLVIALLVGALFAAPRVQAQTAEDFQKLKAMVEQMQKTIEAQNARIAELETNKAAHVPVPAVSQPPGVQQLEAKSQSLQIMEKLAAGGTVSRQSQVTYRDTLNDQQEAASRPKDYTLDPTYRFLLPAFLLSLIISSRGLALNLINTPVLGTGMKPW